MVPESDISRPDWRTPLVKQRMIWPSSKVPRKEPIVTAWWLALNFDRRQASIETGLGSRWIPYTGVPEGDLSVAAWRCILRLNQLELYMDTKITLYLNVIARAYKRD
ncbi:hypothetical protein N8I77_003880 [Diaporthe amygdali]|uniref:Uncharacterized protein n=1 Tax=Phomopsis amygdali TaxID=1214568 RepID=A0AAD9SMB0_PHOAM|nr:hypothetical protein N8I77_003880 [Diaporthe amygdali]